MPAGRPTIYNDILAAEICTRMAEGESLRGICRDDHMPDRMTVLRWLLDGRHEEFCRQYALARDAQADHYADEIIAISDESGDDYKMTDDGPVFDHEHVQRSRLRVDSRKWVAARMAPKRYGDRTALEHTGRDGKDLPAPSTTVQAGVLVVPGVINDPQAWTKLVQAEPSKD